jgi:hypothetical protein
MNSPNPEKPEQLPQSTKAQSETFDEYSSLRALVPENFFS